MSAGTQPTHSQTRVQIPDITANPRVVEVVQPLIDRLQELIREKSVSYDEWHQAVHFMIDVADSGETPLLMDVFFEATVDAVADAASAASTTAIEGPFYVPGAPMLDPPCVMPQRPDEPGDPLVFSGAVTTPDGGPIVGAVLERGIRTPPCQGPTRTSILANPLSTSAASCGPTTKASSSSRRFAQRRTRSPTKARPDGCSTRWAATLGARPTSTSK